MGQKCDYCPVRTKLNHIFHSFFVFFRPSKIDSQISSSRPLYGGSPDCRMFLTVSLLRTMKLIFTLAAPAASKNFVHITHDIRHLFQHFAPSFDFNFYFLFVKSQSGVVSITMNVVALFTNPK